MERVGGGTATSLSGGDDTELGVEGLSGVAVTITGDRRWGGEGYSAAARGVEGVVVDDGRQRGPNQRRREGT
jgi:hypothetical protein